MATEHRCNWIAIKKTPFLIDLQYELDVTLKSESPDQQLLDMLNSLISQLTKVGIRMPLVPPYSEGTLPLIATQAAATSPSTIYMYGSETGWHCEHSPVFVGDQCFKDAKKWLADPANDKFMKLVKLADLHILVGCGDGPPY